MNGIFLSCLFDNLDVGTEWAEAVVTADQGTHGVLHPAVVEIFLYKFDLVDVLLFLAIVAGQDAVSHVEMCGHRLVVGDALGIVAFDDTLDFLRGLNGFLFDDLVVADDIEDYLRGYDGETRDFVLPMVTGVFSSKSPKRLAT